MLSILTRFGGNAPCLPLLPAPAPLPSLQTAFSRRAALLGAVVSTGALAGSVVRSNSATDKLSFADDAALTALAAELDATLDGAAYVMEPVHDEADHSARLRHADALILRIVDLPAAGLAGIKAKAKAYLDSGSYDVMNCAELATSLAEDVERICGATAA